MVWSAVLSARSTSTWTPDRFIGAAIVPMSTPLPRVTVVGEAPAAR